MDPMGFCGLPRSSLLLGFTQVTPEEFSAPRYGPETLLGNWFEETSKKRIECEDFYLKKSCNQLLSQGSQAMVNELCQKITLKSTGTEDVLRFGDVIQIIQPGPDCCSAREAFPFHNFCDTPALALSSSVPVEEVDCKPWLGTSSEITASPQLCPMMRNTFIVENPECPASKEIINYGDTFRIRAVDGRHKYPIAYFKLYLHSAPAVKFETMARHSGKPLVRLSDCLNANTLWMAHPKSPELKIRMPFGIPVTVNSPVLIKHALSGKNLSVETNFPVLTYFGCEMEITVDTKFHSLKQVSWENFWRFETQQLQEDDQRQRVDEQQIVRPDGTEDHENCIKETVGS